MRTGNCWPISAAWARCAPATPPCRSGDAWDIPVGRVLFGRNLQTVAPDSLTLAPHGFCMVVK